MLRSRRLKSAPNGLLQNCTQYFHLGKDYLHHVYHHKYTTHSAPTLPGSYPVDPTLFSQCTEGRRGLKTSRCTEPSYATLQCNKTILRHTCNSPATHPRSHGSIPVISRCNLCSTTWHTSSAFSSHFGVPLPIKFSVIHNSLTHFIISVQLIDGEDCQHATYWWKKKHPKFFFCIPHKCSMFPPFATWQTSSR